MNSMNNHPDRQSGPSTRDGSAPDLDLIVVGAGLAGIYMLYKAQTMGLRVKAFEAGSGVGGTWYWNRYPGCRVDARSALYSYSFSEELEQDWNWSELFATQPELEAYCNHVVDRFGLRSSITFDTSIASATFDEGTDTWRVVSEHGDSLTSRFIVLATGGFAVPVFPDIPGRESFAGEVYHTGRWPDESVSFAGKRVGLIGTGASGNQVVTAVSNKPVEGLFVFHRTPHYCLRERNQLTDPEYDRVFKDQYRPFREKTLTAPQGGPYPAPDPLPDPFGPSPGFGPVGDLNDADFSRRVWDLWGRGTHVLLTNITDLGKPPVNRRVADFLRDRVRELVHDPNVAEVLCPKRDELIGGRRVLLASNYLEAFNKQHVHLVDIKAAPIAEIDAAGVRTSEKHYDLDTLIFATGFDTGTGSMLAIDIVGRGGVSLASKWRNGPTTYLGLLIAGFPNMFMIAQAGSPGIRSQMMNSIEQHVEWISRFVTDARTDQARAVEATPEAEQAWTEHVAEVASRNAIVSGDSPYWGSNIPGKPRVFLSYVGGVGPYRSICDAVRERGYEGIVIRGDGWVKNVGTTWSGPEPTGASGEVLGGYYSDALAAL